MTARALDRLVQALGARAAPAPGWLAPGLDAARLDAAERQLGLALPAPLRALYARHDGERLPPGVSEGVFSRVQFLSLGQLCAVVEERRRLPPAPTELEVLGPVEAVSWSQGWLPFARDFGDNFVAVDTLPPAGVAGQVVYLGFDDGRLEVLADSLQAFLEDEAVLLESGERQVVPSPGRAVTALLQGVARWKPGEVVPVPGHDLSVVVVAAEETGRAARTMASGLCVVVALGTTALSFSGCPRLIAARLLEQGREVSMGLGTATVRWRGAQVTCLLLPAPQLHASTALELEFAVS